MSAAPKPAVIGISIDPPTTVTLSESKDSPMPKKGTNPFIHISTNDSDPHLADKAIDLEQGTSSHTASPLPEASRATSRTTLTYPSLQSRNASFDLPSRGYGEGDPTMWPTRKELEEKALFNKRQDNRKNWNFLGTLDRRSRLWAKIAIAFIVIAVAVGIGVGVTIAVHGKVYKAPGEQAPIPGDGSS